MPRTRTLLAALIVTLVLAGPAGAATQFGRLFPTLPAFTAPTDQQLADLAQTQLDTTGIAGNNCAPPGPAGPTCTFSGFSYMGQFIDHDLTLDQCCPSPTSPVDPGTIANGRTFRFDLDSVYGNGPTGSPQLYQPDHLHLRLQAANVNGVRDLPRAADGTAVIGDGRNDENEIISQIHFAFLALHNRVVDETPGCPQSATCFTRARALVERLYQWVVVHDVLPHFVGQATVDRFLNGTQVRCEVFCRASFTPVEFSVAAYRFGHSIVRNRYSINDDPTTGLIHQVDVFNLATNVDLRGGVPLQADRVIEWKYFFPALNEEGPADPDNNVGRLIDPFLSASLFQLPIPGAEAAGSNVLAFRNMLRAKSYGLPSYETVAARMGVAPVDTGVHGLPGFAGGTPLWYGILAESAQTTGGRVLGPVGGRIVAEVFLRVLKDDPTSILNPPTFHVPARFDADGDGRLTVSDLLVDAGVAPLPS